MTQAKETNDEAMIYRLMALVMAEIGPIGKDQTNTFQKYKFRGIDDIYNAVQSVLAKHGIVPIPFLQKAEHEIRPSKEGGTLMHTFLEMDYTFYAPDGSHLTARLPGEAMDSSDKSTNKALSAAQKYSFVQIFCIPTTEIKDSEHDNPEPVYKRESEVTMEDWQKLKDMGKKNKWPEVYMKVYIDNKKKTGKSLVDVYEDALNRFGKENTQAVEDDREVVTA